MKITPAMILSAFLVTPLFAQDTTTTLGTQYAQNTDDTENTEENEEMAPTPRFEIGALLGEPIGLSMKFWHNTVTATDVAAAWSFTEDGIFEMHINLLLHPLNLRLITGGANFPLYIGPGFAARVGDEWFLGVRLPIGLEYIATTLPLTFFGEVAPQWQFTPEDKFVLSGGAGIRLKFGSIE